MVKRERQQTRHIIYEPKDEDEGSSDELGKSGIFHDEEMMDMNKKFSLIKRDNWDDNQ